MPAFASAETSSGGAAGAAELKVGAALRDPPFEFVRPDGPAGFDIALMQRIAAKLSRTWQLVRYAGADFNGIFAGLDTGAYDCVASGTTITPVREKVADFCEPYGSRVISTTSGRAWHRRPCRPRHRRAAR
jgi:ABC-type amino acid transport substrate-binding protein